MVAMRMGYQYGVEVVNIVAQHLLTEIGPDVDEDVFSVYCHQRRRPQALVSLVRRAAHPTAASHYRHALRGPSTQERQLHPKN
jgi:hypothetical protein